MEEVEEGVGGGGGGGWGRGGGVGGGTTQWIGNRDGKSSSHVQTQRIVCDPVFTVGIHVFYPTIWEHFLSREQKPISEEARENTLAFKVFQFSPH